MKESIKTLVIVKEGEAELEIEYEDDVITFYLDNKKLFRMDFDWNFKNLVQRAIEIWGSEEN